MLGVSYSEALLEIYSKPS